MSNPVVFPSQVLQPQGVTLTRVIGEHLFVGRANVLEVYEKVSGGTQLSFVTSHTFTERIIYFDKYKDNYLLGFSSYLLVVDYRFKDVASFDSIPKDEQYQISQVQYQRCNDIVICMSTTNNITFIHLRMLKSQTVFYRTGQILSIAANGELFAILASATYIDPGNVMHDFKNLHQNYLAIYSTHGDHIIETQKIT